MKSPSHDLQTLATLAGRGDAMALAQLRQALEPQMVHIVRRAMRNGAHPSGLTRRIRATANNLCADGRDSRPWATELRQRLIRRVAQRVCDTLLSRLGAGLIPGLPSRDTIAN